MRQCSKVYSVFACISRPNVVRKLIFWGYNVDIINKEVKNSEKEDNLVTVNLLSQTILSIRGNSLANNSTPVISANRIASDLPSIINRRAELLHQNERAADAQTAAKISNSLFLSHTIPVANSEGNYIVDGVLFSKNELAQCRSIMQSAAAGIETSGTVDYINYAQISIANRAIQTFASENLNKEQATVLTGAMQNYVEDILATEKTLLSGAGYITSYSEECSAY